MECLQGAWGVFSKETRILGEEIASWGYIGEFFFFFLRKISPELTSAANPPLFVEKGGP